MSKKTKAINNNYQIKFLVKAIVGVDVASDNPESAIEKAKAALKNGVFHDGLDYIDGNEELIGYDNLDLWKDVNN